MYDVVVVGAGPAGLMAAGVAGGDGASVLLVEKMEKPARKLRISGKGRCNITNTADLDKFMSKVRAGCEFVSFAFQEFDNKSVMNFLASIGLDVIVERGERVFPSTGRAQDVANTIENWVSRQNVDIRCNAQVKEIVVKNSVVAAIELSDGEIIECKSVILTTGGVSYPLTGSDGEGHEMAYDLGHSIVPLRPSLVPLVADESMKALVGLELRNVNTSLMVDENLFDSRFGEVVFYDNSISGPTVLALSRFAVDALLDSKKVALILDIKPALSQEKIVNRINREIALIPSAPIKVLLDKLAPRGLHSKIAKQAGINAKGSINSLNDRDIVLIAEALKSLKFRIIDYRPFSEAIVTAGGVSTNEIDEYTMQSKLVKNLFFAGELIDIDADTGGYNIQLALSTGHLAGRCAAASALKNRQ
ncbi:MAG: NAD(P)/FAD-dependent oxidoreductase [Mucinivorans sp.]